MNDAFSHAKHEPPFRTLGDQLKLMRERHQESLAEVSGAVEINIDALERIEAGHDRPAEDILLLLLNHFEVQDQEVVRFWELAGYDDPPVDTPAQPAHGRSGAVVVLAMDVRTMYTDSVQIQTNKAGLVMQFSQQSSTANQLPVARVGMSYDQAQQVLENLQRALLHAKYQAGPKQLPPADSSSAA